MKTYMLDHTHKPENCPRSMKELEKADSSLKGKNFLCGCEGDTHHGYFVIKAKTAKEAMEKLPSWIRKSTHAIEVNEMNYP